MTTLAQVREAWRTDVFEQSTILSLTPQTYNYELNLESTLEVTKLRYEGRINAFQYITNRALRLRLSNQTEQRFEVSIEYFLEADTTGEAYNDVLEAFETIDTAVRANLGSNWNSLVEYYQAQTDVIQINQRTIENIAVWVGSYRYLGFKNI